MLDEEGTAKIIDFGSSCPKLGSHFEQKLPSKFDYKRTNILIFSEINKRVLFKISIIT